MSDPITTYYLQMLNPDELKAKLSPSPQAQVIECQDKNFHLNRFFYQYVGEIWQWFDKKSWSDAQWQEHSHRDEIRLFMLTWQGTPAGYFELEKHADGSVEILYFGLAEAYLGKGLGGYLLSQAIEQAWGWQSSRVWVHTCNLDHPNALANYQARGLTLYRTEVESVESDSGA